MITYNLPVNADLVDELELSAHDWQELSNIIHFFLELEYLVKVTGSTGASVRGREVASFKDFL